MTSTRDAVLADDRAYVFHSWSAQQEIAALPVAKAAGSTFWDYDDNAYLDFSSQLVNTNLGHQHPAIVSAIQAQAARLCTIAPQMANDVRGQLAKKVVELAGDPMAMVFFTNGGADANEHAVRMARLHTGRHKVLAAYRSYHGGTQGAVTLTGDPRRWPNEPGMPGVVHFFGPHLYRSPWRSRSPEEETERALTHLSEVVLLEGSATIAAIILEPVVGTNGVLVPPPGYLRGVRELCDRNGIMLIADEVMTGFGRIGEWFGIHAWQVAPDLITFAKGINCGYVPLGGVIISQEIADTFAHRTYPGGLTYSGHPLACASALATLEAIRDENVLEHVRKLDETVLQPRLMDLADRHVVVGNVRGLGMMWAIELVRDRQTREPYVPFNATGSANTPMAELVLACRDRGLWPFVHHNRIHIVPPLNITETDLNRGLDILDDVLP